MKIRQSLFYLAILALVLASCKPEVKPPVISCVFSDVTVEAGQTSAVITCRNESVDDDKVHASVLLSKNENITDATKYPMRLQDDTLRCTINGLESNTMYFFCFEVSTANEYKRSEEIHHFETTGGGSVVVTTSEAINITQTSATGGGSVTAEDNYTVSMRGVCWDTIHNPNALQSPHLTSGEGTGLFVVSITGLRSGTTYHMRAYAVCNDVIYYGNELSFTTLTIPIVTTGQVSNITPNSATGAGNVTDTGGAEVTQRGVCWSTSHDPTISGSHAAASNSGTGDFTVNMTGLTANTTYYVRAYATNSAGTAYGNEVSFTTLQASLPSVTTSQVTNITQTSAKGGGDVTSDGDASVTVRGICWSTSHNPTINDHGLNSGSGMGSYTVNMTSLTPNTTYYVRAYARNSVGTAYGSEVSFTTTGNGNLPTVITSQVTNITQTTARGGGNVANSGGATVSSRGVCWSTNHNPSVSDSYTTNGTGTGSFTSSMTGLTVGTTYYVRAYATNSAGTAYGDEVSFTTFLASLPTVTTRQVTNITQTTADGGGYVAGSGGATVSARGVCWSTTPNPSVSGNHTTDGTGLGSFTSSMTGLTANTTYYVRAYATNSTGTAYGNEVSFTTLSSSGGGSYAPAGAINGKFTINANGDQVYFSQGNLQYQASTNTWRFATNQYDYVGNDNSNISQTYSGWIDLFGWGTSGYHDSSDPYNVNYQPWSTSTAGVNEYYNRSGYGPSTIMLSPNLTGSSAHYDWGVHNAISNGGGQAGQWRTLTGGSSGEWNYVFNTRSTNSGIRYAMAQVNNVDGVILLPDNWSSNYYTLYGTNSYGASFSINVISASTWVDSLEAHGAVFLPAAGYRNGTSVLNVGSCGDYWSSSYYNPDYAYYVYFGDVLYTGDWYYRHCGLSVRLVQDANN